MSQVRRRDFLVIASAFLVVPITAIAQQDQKVWRIGYLTTADPADSPHLLDAFRAGLREHGYVDDQSFVIEHRWAESTSRRLDDYAKEFERSKVDLILAYGTPATMAAKRATSTIPIVMAAVGDPVGAGLVISLSHPGGNITGVTSIDVGLAAKRLELLRDVLPKLSQIAVLRNPTNPSGKLQFKETQAAAQSLGMELNIFDVRNAAELESAFSAIPRAGASAVTVLADPIFISQRKMIASLALRGRIASVFARNENAEAGGLIAYGPKLTDLFRQAATYVDKVLKGAKPADLPTEQPSKFELVVNMQTAKALGLTIPQSILFRADRVIE